MWPILFFLALVLLIWSQVFWRRRLGVAEREKARLRHESEQSRAEEKRARFEITTREEALLNSISEGILFLDGQSRIVGVNEAMAGMFPLDGTLKGKSLLEGFRLHPLVELVQEIQRSGESRDVEISIPGTPQRFLEVSGAILKRPDGGIVLTFHEITRLKQLENMRKEFVANVSHELRTPLTLIKGFAETLLDGAVKDPVAAERFVSTIQRNAERLALIIEDLLTISSLESGQVSLEKQSVRLRALVQRIIAELHGRPAPKPVNIENLVAEEMVVCADLQRLQQVLTNLIDNAIKYGREKGHVRISAKMMPDGGAEVLVADDGPGIPREAMDRVFERFYRVDKARSREQGGTGLGLSIVKHIVQSHGGRVWVESELEKGSTFYFTLPAEASEAQ